MSRKLCLLCGQFQNVSFSSFFGFLLDFLKINCKVGGLVLTVGVWVAADKASFVQMTQVSVPSSAS